jgi:hypothetical protein
VILISRNTTKFCEILLYFLSQNFAKFCIIYFAKLFHNVNFSNTSTFREISYKLFCKIVLLSKLFEFNTYRINFNQHFLKVLPVFRIQEILARIRIIRFVPEKTDIDTYKCLWIFDIKVIFLVILKCNKIQNCILILISSQKFRELPTSGYLSCYHLGCPVRFRLKRNDAKM